MDRWVTFAAWSVIPRIVVIGAAMEELDRESVSPADQRPFTSNVRIPRFLDFYTCISATGTLGVCLPEPYCSYMIEGAFVDANPTKSCSHTMLNEYGCCTLPCSSTNAIPVRSAQAESFAGDDFRSSTVPSTKRPVTISTFTEPAASTVPPLFSPAIALSPTDFPTCGHANPAFKDVVRNGPRESQLAPTGKWCWQAAIMDSNMTFKCGGTLLNNRHILTVAHCVQKNTPATLLVRLGDTNLRSSDDNEDLIDMKVSKITIHSGYTGQSPYQVSFAVMGSYRAFVPDQTVPDVVHEFCNELCRKQTGSKATISNHNLAILSLEADVPINRNRICAVCLPSPTAGAQLENIFYRNSSSGRCITTGYGKLENRDEFPLMRLKEVPVPLMNNEQCTLILRNLLGSKFSLPDTFICAGGEGLSDGCEYDGGGPVVCPLNAGSPDSVYVLTGVVTWGIDCARSGVPGVYARISNYTDWIRTAVSVP